VDYTKRLSGNAKYTSSVICFCDIPEGDIGLHAKKYSPFGLAFPKWFLVPQGATPVMYIASQAITDEPIHPERKLTRAEFYDTAEQDYCRNIIGVYPKPLKGGAWNSRRAFHRLVEHYIFPFMKFFEAGRSDADPDNFYMEREWRLLGVATFRTADIARIYVSPAFRQRALADIGLSEAVIRTCPAFEEL
jgi:hypothetical protein